MILTNPAYPESQDIVADIIPLEVEYTDDDGRKQMGVIEVHRIVADDVRMFFKNAYELHFPIHKLGISSDYGWDDAILIDKNITSGFNFRPIKDTATISLHGKGLAFDVNPRANPYIRYKDDTIITDPPNARYDPEVPGTLTGNHPLVVLMRSLGWDWGGDWTPASGRVDYQHFQKNI